MEHGVRFDVVTTGETAGAYICKLQDGRGVGSEVARGDLKSGRLGSVTPFEILDYFERTGDAAAADLWAEWEQATHGRRALTMVTRAAAAVARRCPGAQRRGDR
jgi:hypothetical protein